jgi:antitoxin CptB
MKRDPDPGQDIPVMDDTKNRRRARILWHCRRGMLELDILLQDFILKYYEILDQKEHDTLDILLDYPDPVLFDLLMGKVTSTDQEIGRVVEKIRSASAH